MNHPALTDKVGFPLIAFLGKEKDCEYIRKEKNGSNTFSYSQTGLTAFRAQLVALVKDSIPTNFDEAQYTEKELTAMKAQYDYMVASAEQTNVTVLSGSAVMDEKNTLFQYQMQYSYEAQKLDCDGNEGQTATKMRFVTEILSRTDAEAEQKLTELFAQLPE